MHFALLFLLAITGPTELDQKLSQYRDLVSQATQATVNTSSSTEVRKLAAALSENVKFLADPIWQDTFFLRSIRNNKNILRAIESGGGYGHLMLREVDSLYDKLNPGDEGYEYGVPDTKVELKKTYFLFADREVLVQNEWIFSHDQISGTSVQFPIKPKFFRGDACMLSSGYFTLLNRFGNNLLVEYRPLSDESGNGCPGGTLFGLSEDSFLHEIEFARDNGVSLIRWADKYADALAPALELYRSEVEMRKFIDTKMVKTVTEP